MSYCHITFPEKTFDALHDGLWAYIEVKDKYSYVYRERSYWRRGSYFLRYRMVKTRPHVNLMLYANIRSVRRDFLALMAARWGPDQCSKIQRPTIEITPKNSRSVEKLLKLALQTSPFRDGPHRHSYESAVRRRIEKIQKARAASPLEMLAAQAE